LLYSLTGVVVVVVEEIEQTKRVNTSKPLKRVENLNDMFKLMFIYILSAHKYKNI
jgi:hypothetical protein